MLVFLVPHSLRACLASLLNLSIQALISVAVSSHPALLLFMKQKLSIVNEENFRLLVLFCLVVPVNECVCLQQVVIKHAETDRLFSVSGSSFRGSSFQQSQYQLFFPFCLFFIKLFLLTSMIFYCRLTLQRQGMLSLWASK